MTRIFRYDKCGLILALIISCAPGYQFLEAAEIIFKTSPLHDSPLRIIDSIPRPDAGIRNSIRVHHDTSFAVLIETESGVDPTNPDCIRFLISDGDFERYQRNPDSPAVRIITVERDPNQTTLIWAVYDRSLEPALPPFYALDTIVKIEVSVKDLSNQTISGQIFSFRVESDAEQAIGFRNIPASRSFTIENPEGFFDAGIEITDGALTGARILYDSREPLMPDFGPIDEIDSVIDSAEQPVGTPLNLMPHTVFNRPVKLFIPFSEEADTEDLDIYYHNGARWLPACDADGTILPGGKGWIVPGSRVNHATQDPPLVEIEVYHFSAAQAVISGSSTTTDGIERERHGSGATVVVSCFVDVAGPEGRVGMLSLLGVLSLLSLLCLLGSKRVKALGFRFSTRMRNDDKK
jgi:hypothetical protein